MISIDDIEDSDIEYKSEIIEEVQNAINYLSAFKWCTRVIKGSLVNGFGYILCIFQFEIEPLKESAADDKLWVIVGDIPYAYLDTIKYTTANEALDFYCYLMQEWIDNISAEESVKDCYPINVSPTKEHANMLQTRIDFIKEDFLPIV